MRPALLPLVALWAMASACSREAAVPAAPHYPREAAAASGGLYTNCAACHGASGQGGLGPALRGNQRLADADFAITMVLAGTQRMPAFAAALSDAQIAQVLTVVRSQWGNKLGPVTAQQVAARRAAMSAPPADPAARR